ncbi:MAG TPA: NAD(P)H-binding protein [Ktedonobacterales bacterium]|jgi:uncharacterized protein YbjT (DUF2867 family)|nr:NAD(P)H-binding protein [Ktedonobacterales bacterium]
MASVLVTGGAGKLGREVVARLARRGHHVRSLTHMAPASPLDGIEVDGIEVMVGDLGTGAGLKAALDGIEVVIHAASNSQQAQAVDIDGTRHLLAAAQAHDRSPHIIYVSIVGVDRSEAPYYKAKYAAERLVQQSGLPWSILRATQFHNFILDILRSLGIDTQPEVAVPDGVRLQSIEIGEVADRLVAIAEGAPLRQVEEMGGPQILSMEEMAAIYLRAQGLPTRVHSEPLHSPLFDGFRRGAILTPDHATGVMTWETYVSHLSAG